MNNRQKGLSFLLENVKQAVNLRLAIAVIGVAACIAFDSWNDLITALTSKSGYGTVSVYDFYFNAVAYGGVYSHYILAMLSALPFAASYCVESRSHMAPFLMARSGKNNYSQAKFIVGALAGGAAVGLGTILFVCLLAFRLPLVTEDVLTRMQGIAYYGLLSSENGLWFFAVAAYLAFLTGVLWAGVAVCVSAYIPNPYIVIASPYVASFLLVELSRLLWVPGVFRLDFWLSARTSIGSDAITIIAATLAVVLITSVCGFVFARRVKWRLENGIES